MSENKIISSVREWEEVTKPFHVRIRDFLPGGIINEHLKTKEFCSFLCLDQNVEDFTDYLDVNPPNTLIEPVEYFENACHLLWKSDGNNIFQGFGVYADLDLRQHFEPWFFHFEYKEDHWCTINENGYIETNDNEFIH